MADRNIILAPPPGTTVPDKDPMLERVDLKSMDWAARKSQQPALNTSATGPISHVKNQN